jgi:predicted RNase H-like HicB family nuclease
VGSNSKFEVGRNGNGSDAKDKSMKRRRKRNLEVEILKNGRAEMSAKHYPVIIERTTTGYSAYSPDVHECAAAGYTAEETRRNFQDALTAHFEAMREVGEPIPKPHASVDYVEVGA